MSPDTVFNGYNGIRLGSPATNVSEVRKVIDPTTAEDK